MLLIASLVFVYYTTWAILLVSLQVFIFCPMHSCLHPSPAILSRIPSYPRPLPGPRMGYTLTCIPPHRWPCCRRAVCGIGHRKGKTKEQGKTNGQGSMTGGEVNVLKGYHIY